MGRGRIILDARGGALLVARRAQLTTRELDGALSPSTARARLEGLSAVGRRRLVDAFGDRFPNDRAPTLGDRVLRWVDDRVSAGALSVVEVR